MKISTHFKIRVVKLSRLEHRAKNAKVESSSLSLAKLLLRDRSFIRCRKERQGEGHCKNAKKKQWKLKMGSQRRPQSLHS